MQCGRAWPQPAVAAAARAVNTVRRREHIRRERHASESERVGVEVRRQRFGPVLRRGGGPDVVAAELPVSRARMPNEDRHEMENEDWQETVGALVDAKRCLASAWQILDGTDGAASGVEHALNAALASIDAVYAIEYVNAYNADVASPVEVQEFWRSTASSQGSRPERDGRNLDDLRRPTTPCLEVRRDASLTRRWRSPGHPVGNGGCRTVPSAAHVCREVVSASIQALWGSPLDLGVKLGADSRSVGGRPLPALIAVQRSRSPGSSGANPATTGIAGGLEARATSLDARRTASLRALSRSLRRPTTCAGSATRAGGGNRRSYAESAASVPVPSPPTRPERRTSP